MLLSRIITAIIALIFCAIIFFGIVGYDKNVMTVSEIRMYIRLFLFCLIILAFGILRLYNAVVRNTSALYDVKLAFKKFQINLRKIVSDLNTQKSDVRASLRTFLSGLDALVTRLKNIVK